MKSVLYGRLFSQMLMFKSTVHYNKYGTHCPISHYSFLSRKKPKNALVVFRCKIDPEHIHLRFKPNSKDLCATWIKNNEIISILNNFVLIPFRSAKYYYPGEYWYLTERNGTFKTF